MTRVALLVVCLAMAACTGASAPTAPPTRTPEPEPSGYTDAEQTAIVLETIEYYCTEPALAWCEYLGTEEPHIRAEGISLFIGVEPTIPIEIAEQLCADLAAAHFDDEGNELPFHNVHVNTGADDTIDCDSPGT